MKELKMNKSIETFKTSIVYLTYTNDTFAHKNFQKFISTLHDDCLESIIEELCFLYKTILSCRKIDYSTFAAFDKTAIRTLISNKHFDLLRKLISVGSERYIDMFYCLNKEVEQGLKFKL